MTLEQQLNEFRKYIADAFEDTIMLSPLTSSFEDGIFTFTAKELIGARTPFNEITIKSLIPLDRKKLYLSNSQQTRPFPISSILWRYYATKDNGKKIEHLFHFFEAFSEFLSMLILSALMQDKEFYKEENHKWIGKDEKFQNWYLRATFGRSGKYRTHLVN